MKQKKTTLRKHGLLVTELQPGVPVTSGVFATVDYDADSGSMWLFWADWDLFFVLQGCAIFELRNGSVLRVPKNHFLLLPPFTPTLRAEPTSAVRFFVFHFAFHPIPTSAFGSVRRNCMDFPHPVRIPWIFSKRDAPEVWKAYREVIKKDYPVDEDPWQVALDTTKIVSALGRFALDLNLPHDETVFDPKEELDSRIIDLFRRISENPLLPWKISEIANSLGITKEHLAYLCRQNLGNIRLKQFIIQRRLNYAAHLLQSSNTKTFPTVKEVSAACGFRSPEFFCRQFKKSMGVSPLEFRKRSLWRFE